MDDTKRRRKGALTCGNRCRKALSRDAKRRRQSNYTDAGSVTPAGVPYAEPPRPGESDSYGSLLADARFRSQLANEGIRAMPLTDEERDLLARQRRNPGVLLPELAQLQVDRAEEQQRRELAETSQYEMIKPENPLNPESIGSLARRARESRQANRHLATNPDAYILRPGHQSGPHPWDDEPECITAPWSRGRW
jgi:hypothetical protein